MRVKDARQTFLGIWIRRLVEGAPIEVYGDGRLVRDFNYVDDAVDALLSAGVSPRSDGLVFNLGGEERISLAELASLLIELNGGGEYRIVPFPAERKAIDIGDYYADWSRIRERPRLESVGRSRAGPGENARVLPRARRALLAVTGVPPPELIPQADPRRSYIAHRAEIDAAIALVLERGRYVLGENVAAFEEEFAAWLGARWAVGVASGTDAVRLALAACDIGAGDEVITVSHTAIATVAAIELSGAAPVLVDVDEQTLTIDPARARGGDRTEEPGDRRGPPLRAPRGDGRQFSESPIAMV